MVRALASRKRRSRVTRKLDATMKAKPRKKRIVRVCRVASTSIERLHLWPSPPVNAMLCTMPSNSSARIGSAAGGMFTSSRRSTVILIAHNSRIPISINSKMAIDQGSTAPCAKAVKDKTTIKPTAMDWSRRDCRGGLRPPTVSVKGGLPDFSNVEIVKPDCSVGGRFVTEFGPLLYGNHQWTFRRLEFECPWLPFLGALGRRLRCRDPLFRVLTGDGHARPFRSSEIFRLHVVVEPEMPAGPKQKDLFDFVFQTRCFMAEKVDSQRALTCV